MKEPALITGALAGRDVTAVSPGGFLNCALADGRPFCWGQGQLGRGVDEQSSVPVAVDVTGALAGRTITAIDAGQNSACVVASGAAYCWGREVLGRDEGEAPLPTPIDSSGVLQGRSVTDVSVSDRHACAVADGRAYCWGFGQNAELGQGDSRFGAANIVGVGPPIPVDDSGVLQGKKVTDVDAGRRTTCAIADEQVFCWGEGIDGAMGNGPASTYPYNNRVPVSPDMTGALAGKTITHLSVGDSNVCVLASGTPVCWGSNMKTAGGPTTDDSSNRPVALPTAGIPPGVVLDSIATLSGGTCVTGGGSLYCWDGNRRADPPVRRDVDAALQRPVTSVALHDGAIYVVGSTAGPAPDPQWPAPIGMPVIGPQESDHDPAASWDAADLTLSRLRVAGWAFDPDDPSGTTTLHLYDSGPEGTTVRRITAADPRPDLAAVMPAAGALHGFVETVRLSPGPHTVCLYAINSGRGAGNPHLGCRSIDVGGPLGVIDGVGQSRAGIVDVTGWAADPDMWGLAVDVHLYVRGPSGLRVYSTRTTTVLRSDVQAAFPWAGHRTGFAAGVPAPEIGDYEICAYVINVRPPRTNPFVGCRTTVTRDPVGAVESVRLTDSSIVMSGWALQPGNSNAAEVLFQVASVTYPVRGFATLDRPDVGQAFPGSGDRHGFSIELPRGDFTSPQICGSVLAALGGVNHRQLGVVGDVVQTRPGCFANPAAS